LWRVSCVKAGRWFTVPRLSVTPTSHHGSLNWWGETLVIIPSHDYYTTPYHTTPHHTTPHHTTPHHTTPHHTSLHYLLLDSFWIRTLFRATVDSSLSCIVRFDGICALTVSVQANVSATVSSCRDLDRPAEDIWMWSYRCQGL
jgi:hypothetical protein